MARHTMFFSFADESAAIAALSAWRSLDDDGNAIWAGPIDAGFPIIDMQPVLDETDALVTPATFLTGYHVNLLTDARNESLETIDGWTGTACEDVTITDPALKWVLVAGTQPVTARQVFA